MLTEGSTKSNRKTPTGNARPKFPPPSRNKMRRDLIYKRDKLKQKLKDAEEELKNHDENADLSDDQRLAIYLHKKMCTFNHTDGCSWFYHIHDGVHDWDEYSHEEWLQKAQRVLTIGQPVDFIKKIVGLLYE